MMRLDEMGRENFSRLKRIKAMLEERKQARISLETGKKVTKEVLKGMKKL